MATSASRRLVLAAMASDSRTPFVGTWTGESICTSVRPACRDERAAYHISIPDQPATVTVVMNKVVDGKEESMGTLLFHVDSEAKMLTSDFKRGDLHLLWTFTRAGSKMTGTLKQLPDGAIVRNIRLARIKASAE